MRASQKVWQTKNGKREQVGKSLSYSVLYDMYI